MTQAASPSDNNHRHEQKKEHNQSFDDKIFYTNVDSCQHFVKLVWKSPPKNVLMVKKREDKTITTHLDEIGLWLNQTYDVNIYVEPLVKETELSRFNTFSTEELPLSYQKFDFIICLGGDGTLLHVNSLFKDRVPPVMAFYCGTLGFLTPILVPTVMALYCGTLGCLTPFKITNFT
eukprot:TRINITY_DN3238_c0_g1_i2.p1 TRINITY_DN3238_c0_g1~~TRINITY_DN3238_c0_g1_i2.p1  ORF type:complete len:176 (-),score=18.41 TRINITY_DN3238_c0_g1_i2:39-566(-)